MPEDNLAEEKRGHELLEDLCQDSVSLVGWLKSQTKHIPPKLFEELIPRCETFSKKCIDLKTKITQDFANANVEISNLIDEYKKLLAKYNAILEQALSRASFIRFVDEITNDEVIIPRIEVKNSCGNYGLVSYFVEDIAVETLKYGQIVYMTGGGSFGHVVVVHDEFSIEGVEATVKEVLENDSHGARFLVSDRELGESAIMHARDNMDTLNIENGSRVLVDGSAKLILEILGESESQEFVVAEVPDVEFEDIGGLELIIQDIDENITWPINYPSVDEMLGLPSFKGCALKGPPGVGKTMLAKAIVNRLHMLMKEKHHGETETNEKPLFFHIKGPEILNKWVGNSEATVRRIFAEARKHATPTRPVGIFIDEAESWLRIRGSGISSDTENTLVPQFCTEVDGLESRGNIIILIASNRMDLIDRAVIRSGRIDKVITVPRPNKDAAVEIFKKYLLPKWGQVHPIYNKDVYVPLRKGKPKKDHKTQKEKKYTFRNDPKRVVDYLVTRAVAHMFDDNNPANQFLKVKFVENSDHTIIRYSDLCSGALIENVVKRAKTLARRRYINSIERAKLLVLEEENPNDETVNQLNQLGISKERDEIVFKQLKDRFGLEDLGVRVRDLYMSIENVFAEIRTPSTDEAFVYWLAIEALSDGKSIEGYQFLDKQDVPDEE